SPKDFPNLEFKSLEGQKIKLSEIDANLVLINFWASWCEPCKQEFPQFIELEKLFLDKGFRVVLVNVDEQAVLGQKFIQEMNELSQAALSSYYDTDKQLVEQ